MAFGAPALHFAKAYMLAQLTVCPPPLEAPHADVYFLPKKPEYITEAPIKSLTAEMRNNPDSTVASDSRWFVEGITASGVDAARFNFDFTNLRDESGNICLYVHKVYFSVMYEPTIFLAKELKAPGRECRYKMVKLHEERHVATDLKTINEYMPKIKMELLWYLRSIGPLGPFQLAQARAEVQKTEKAIMVAVQPMMEKLIKARRARQGSIDTIENYRQEAALCPDDNLKPEDVQ
ncbi:MAG: hypothetical protein EPN97_07895 [Alphaproteobacteria bacterium]|nr:MAG: hypothetical protein EPN97_07895 [Alphaproteobacteria bacterium]